MGHDPARSDRERPVRHTSGGMSRRTRTLVFLVVAFGGLASWSAVGMFVNSMRLDAITVRFTGPGAEPKDAVLPGLPKKFAEPDYRVDIVQMGGTHRCSARQDTSAVDGIRFAVTIDVPLGDVQELILYEEDVKKEQVIARTRFAPPSMSSNGYAFGVESSRSFWMALDWYVKTPVGLVVFMAFLLVIIVLLLYLQRLSH